VTGSLSTGAGPDGFDLGAYLARIGLDAPPPVSVEGLALLVRAHRMAIPFENVDIALGRQIDLAPAAIFDKLVQRRRGGYCFEQNALFDRALATMGFDGRPLMGRVWLGIADGEAPPRTHQLELVMLEGKPWIADAGFGGSLTPPLLLAEGESEPGTDGVRFRLARNGDHGWMLSRQGRPAYLDVPDAEAARWQDQYSFTTDIVFAADREMGNHWTSTRPGTRFTSMVMVHRITADGFASLSGNALRLRAGDETRDILLETPALLREALSEHFGMALSPEEAARLHRF